MNEVKSFLNSVRRQEMEFKAVEEELSRVRTDIYFLKSPRLEEKVQTSHQAELSEKVERLEFYEEQVRDELEKLTSLRITAKKIIALEPDTEKRAILIRRYLLGQKWESIAVQMNLGLQWVFKLHGQSLFLLESNDLAKEAIKSEYPAVL